MIGVLRSSTRTERVVLALLLVGYVVAAAILWSGKDFDHSGALSYDKAPLSARGARNSGTTISRISDACFRGVDRDGSRVEIVTGRDRGRRLFACYDEDGGGSVQGARVVDASLRRVTDVATLKRTGVWPYYGVVKSWVDLTIGGVGAFVLPTFALFFATRRGAVQPAPAPWWTSGLLLGVLAAVPVLGWIAVGSSRAVPRARRIWFIGWGVVAWAVAFGLALFRSSVERSDPWGIVVVAYLAVAAVVGAVLGRMARPRFQGAGAPARLVSDSPRGSSLAAPPAPSSPPAAELVRVEAPDTLPSFADVGGMTELKRELKETVGLTLAFTEQADAYRVHWNGVLLHGRPGTGKTYFARATAGELGLNLIEVSTSDLVSAYRGESARNVDAVFALAARSIPCLLFFDEFDSIAARRDDNPDQEARRTVNQLLQSLERTRVIRELVVMAATNDLDALDPAVVRPGRFDRHVHVPLPDREARAAVLAAQLRRRPGADAVDLDAVAARSEGTTPAVLAQVVADAAMTAMRESVASPDGAVVPLTTRRLLDAFEARGGRDRPTVEAWDWDRLVLPADLEAELAEIVLLLADPERAERFGIEPPSGILLFGPPGTGKTSIARVLAAQSRCSFYPMSAADLTSKWVGESERLIAQLFERARDNAPSIVFIDEIDAIAGNRGRFGTYDRQVNQLLQEIDGVESRPGVVVIGATNRKDMLDPALLRGGRLSRHIEIPLPDRVARRELLDIFTAPMPLQGVDLDELATRTEGMSGADLEALCHEAGLQAIVRDGDSPVARVLPGDFAAALAKRLAEPGPAPTDVGPERPAARGAGYL